MKTKILFVTRFFSQVITLLFLFYIILVNPVVLGQDFVNPDMDGPLVQTDAYIPNGWQNVPANDPVCSANWLNISDTPDLTHMNGPMASVGLLGNPQSGNTFVSGLHLNNGTHIYQEGIMQTVNCLTPGQTYNLSFWQAVVKDNGSIDQSGSWSVFVDSVLLFTTTPTFSAAAPNATNFLWEMRQISFTATNSSHTFKFLPQDDDPDQNAFYAMNGILGGSIRMGIDNIHLDGDFHLDFGSLIGDTVKLCQGDLFQVDVAINNATYLWQDGSTNSSITIDSPGQYYVEIDRDGCFLQDTFFVYTPYLNINLGNDTILCDSTITLEVSGGDFYTWSDGSTGPGLIVTIPGEYWVHVNLENCQFSDTIIFSGCLEEEEPTEPYTDILMPNVFTPNQDGVNDIFAPILIMNASQVSIAILNRWGKIVYQSKDTGSGWDGNFQGKPCSDGTYFWHMEFVNYKGNSLHKHGVLQLFR